MCSEYSTLGASTQTMCSDYIPGVCAPRCLWPNGAVDLGPCITPGGCWAWTPRKKNADRPQAPTDTHAFCLAASCLYTYACLLRLWIIKRRCPSQRRTLSHSRSLFLSLSSVPFPSSIKRSRPPSLPPSLCLSLSPSLFKSSFEHLSSSSLTRTPPRSKVARRSAQVLGTDQEHGRWENGE